MDLSTLFGFLLGFGLIGWAIEEAAGPLAGVFASSHATMIVCGGAIASALISYPMPVCMRAGKVLKVLWFHKEHSAKNLIEELVNFAEIARRDGILSLENHIRNQKIQDPFLVKGIQMAIDGTDPVIIEQVLQSELEAIAERHTQCKGMFEAMGKYAPSYGLIGTLIGLIMMLMNLDDPSKIGPGMALGLLGTLYGTAMANMVCLPMAEKLVQRNNEEIFYKNIIMKGVLSIQSGDNPRIVEQRLKTFLSPKEAKSMSKDTEE